MKHDEVMKRLDKIQSLRGSDASRILQLIDSGAFYDEISEAEKDLYCEYRHFDRYGMEEVEQLVNGTLHFRLERTPAPEPLDKIQAEVAAMIADFCRFLPVSEDSDG